MDVQASYSVVCPEHDHEIRFYSYPDNINIVDMSSEEMVDQAAYSDTVFLPHADYIGLRGDIKIVYDITSPSELIRLKAELDNHSIAYEETPQTLTVIVDFDNIEPDSPTLCSAPWTSPVFPRTLLSNTKDSILARIIIDGNYTKNKYKLTKPLSISSSTTKYVFVFDGSCTINGQRLELSNKRHAVVQFEGSVSIVPDTSSLVVVFEEVD